MTITLTSATRIAGTVQAAATTHTLSADLEADLVRRKLATYVTPPGLGGVGVPVTAQTDPLTGVVEKLLAAGASIPPVVVIGQQHVAVSKTDADTNEATLYSLTIPAMTMGPNDALRISTLWTVPSSATNKTLKVKIGATAFMNLVQTTTVSTERPTLIRNRNARNSQIAFNAGAGNGVGSNAGGNQAGSIDFAQEQTLTITGTWGTAGAGSNSITLESVLVELIRAA